MDVSARPFIQASFYKGARIFLVGLAGLIICRGMALIGTLLEVR
jgi:hypothetical protein